MRVLITSPVFPPDLGGPAVYVPSVGRFLVERGHEVKVVAFCSDPAPSGHPFEVVAISRGRLALRYFKAFFLVWRHARGRDVVYVQEHLALFHVLAARLAGVRVVIRMMVDGAWEISHRKGWIDGDDIVTFETKDYGLRVKLVRRLQRLWWGWCSNIIACSEFLRGIAVQRYGVADDKAVRVLNAYHGPSEVPETQAQAREELELAPDRRYALTICRLMVWKGVDGIVRAMSALPDDVHLLVAGDGDMLEPWQAEARERGLGGRVHFLGNVPHARIPLLIRAVDLFVLNSEYEGLSHTLLEVCQIGTPIVCTGVCGNPEVVEDGVNGLLVPPKDDAALAEAMHKLLSEPDLGRQYAAEGLRRMVSFQREANFAEVEAVLERVAAE